MRDFRPLRASLAAALLWGVSLVGSPGEPAKPAVAPASKTTAAPKLAMTNKASAASPTVKAAVVPASAPSPSAKPAAVPSGAPKPAPIPAASAKPAPATPPKPAAAAVAPAKPVIVSSLPPTPESIAASIPKGLVLHFSFDQADPKGGILDKSSQSNKGQATGARWTQTGKIGGGYEFSPPSNHLTVPNNTSLSPKQVTFATWFRTSRLEGTWRRIFEKGSERGFAISIAGDTPGIPTRGRVAVSVPGRGQCLSDFVVTDGTWHHAAATFNGETVKLYIDGAQQKQELAFRGDLLPATDDLVIGSDRPKATVQDSVQSFEGSLDEIMVFNRALSADELKNMVLAMDPNAGKPLFSKNQVTGRLRQLKLLFEEGLLTDEFYEAKVSECEAAGQ